MLTESETIAAKRSENRITESLLLSSIRNALRATGHRQLNHIEINVSEGVVTLTGIVDSYFAKQLAQNVIIKIDQNVQIVNNLDVIRISYPN